MRFHSYFPQKLSGIFLLTISLIIHGVLIGGGEVALAQIPSPLRQTPTKVFSDSDSVSSQLKIHLDNQAIKKGVNSIRMRYGQLLQREESALTKKTVKEIQNDFTQIFQGKNPIVQKLLQTLKTYFTSWAHFINFLVALVLIGVLTIVYRPIKRYLQTLQKTLSQRDPLVLTTFAYLIEIILRVLPTLLFMMGIWAIVVVLALPNQFTQTIFRIAGAVVIYKFLRWFLEIIFAPDEKRHRLIPCDTKIAKYFFYFARVLLQ
ncbi:MAG: hypothetical protein P8Y60_20020, partial [Calditrichota bacterium]